MKIPIDKLKFTDNLQPRITINFMAVDEYAKAMQDGNIFPPLDVVFDGKIYWLWDGYHRLEAIKKVNSTDEIEVNITDGTLQDAEWLALSANKDHGLHRKNVDKRRIVNLALQHPNSKDKNGKDKSHRAIADWCGVSHYLVSSIVKNFTNGSDSQLREISQVKLSATAKILPEVRELIADSLLVDSQQDIKDLASTKPEDQMKVARLVLDGVVNTIKEAKDICQLSQPMQVLLSHKSVEYYTPSHVIQAAYDVMDKIDLDPASCEEAQETIKALNFFTEEDDGLSQEWHGKIWLNPPYSKTGGKSNQELWSQYLISQYKLGNVIEALLLVKATLGYKWFEELWDNWPVCFLRERLSFVKSDGDNSGSSKYGTAIFYLGPDVDKFINVFNQLGRITDPMGGNYILNGNKT